MSEHHGQTWDRSREAVYLRLEGADKTRSDLDALEKRVQATELALAVRDARAALLGTIAGAIAAYGPCVWQWLSAHLK